MTPEEIKAAMSQPLEAATKSINDAVDSKLKSANEKAEAAAKEAAQIRADLDASNAAFNEYKKEMGRKKDIKSDGSFAGNFGEFLAENFDGVKSVKKGNGFSKEMEQTKAVGIMTAAANLTSGLVVTTYAPGMVALPTPKINFTDLVQTVPSATGSYTIYAQDGEGEGSITAQSTPGNAKSQIDLDVKGTVFTADYVSGYVRIAKQMLQDLPFLQSYLPSMLMRKFLKAESGILNTSLVAAATAAAAGSALPYVERLIDNIASLESSDFEASAIVLSPTDWATLIKYKASTSGQYTYPGTLMVNPSGVLTLNGTPIYKASFMTTGKFWVGDWNYAKKIVADGLKVEFFEQDSDNVQKNLITVRIEAREVLGIDLGSAFRYGDFAV